MYRQCSCNCVFILSLELIPKDFSESLEVFLRQFFPHSLMVYRLTIFHTKIFIEGREFDKFQIFKLDALSLHCVSTPNAILISLLNTLVICKFFIWLILWANNFKSSKYRRWFTFLSSV